MGLFGKQLANVVEWEEYRDDCIFWKWTNREIKKRKPFDYPCRTGCHFYVQW